MTENHSHIEVRYVDEHQAHLVLLLPTNLADRLSLYCLESDLAEWFKSHPSVRVVVNFEKVEICSTDVINAILRARRIAIENESTLALCNLRPKIQEVFRLLNLAQLFTIASSQEEAFNALQVPA